jgi:hypothetical protein
MQHIGLFSRIGGRGGCISMRVDNGKRSCGGRSLAGDCCNSEDVTSFGLEK